MRERVTFFPPPEVDFDPADIEIQDAGMLGPQLDMARQDRLTIKLDELPKTTVELLRKYREAHVRWTSSKQYEILDPLMSRSSPGFHLSYQPVDDSIDNSSRLCEFLELFGPLDCHAQEAFTVTKPEEPSKPSTYFYYQELEDLHGFITYGMREVCPELDSICQARMRSLYTASSLDISFDSSANSLVFTAIWPLRSHNLAVPASSERRTEVGVFKKDEPSYLESHELGLAGVVTVLREHNAPKPTMFTFPSRHRDGKSEYTSKFLAPTGLHPTLQLSLSSNQSPEDNVGCSPYAYFTLPKSIFADRYQLDDRLFLASKNLTASRYATLPVDLEAPAYTTKTWGSNVLLELAPPDTEENLPWTAQVPLHLRYLKPSETGEVKVEVPYPAVFWACPSGVEKLDSPFDRLHLGYDGLFEKNTVFWHVTPKPESGNRLMSSVTVPVLKEGGAEWIGLGTAAAVTLGFAWVLWKIASAVMRSSSSDASKSSQTTKKTATTSKSK